MKRINNHNQFVDSCLPRTVWPIRIALSGIEFNDKLLKSLGEVYMSLNCNKLCLVLHAPLQEYLKDGGSQRNCLNRGCLRRIKSLS